MDNDVTLDQLDKVWIVEKSLPTAAVRLAVLSLAHGGQRRYNFPISGFLTEVR